MAGVYRGHGERSELQPAPLWNRLVAALTATAPSTSGPRPARRAARAESPGELGALQFSSLAEPGLAVLRALGPRATLERSPPLAAPARIHAERKTTALSMRIAVADGALEAAARADRSADAGEHAALERIAAYVATAAEDSSQPGAAERCARAQARPERERLLIEHRRAWAQRWEQADVRIDGDPELQLAVRLALFHLIGSVGGQRRGGGRRARPDAARGYRGHVFWDSDVFVLPFLAATHPAGARAILEYRVRRLPAARAAARAAGRAGRALRLGVGRAAART